MNYPGLPKKQGLYDPRFEHDACGVGFVVNIKGVKSHENVEQALTVLQNLDHRGAGGCEDGGGAALHAAAHPKSAVRAMRRSCRWGFIVRACRRAVR